MNSERILKAIHEIDDYLPEGYDRAKYDEDKAFLVKDSEKYSQEGSFSLLSLVLIRFTKQYVRKQKLIFLLGKITYNPNCIFTEKELDVLQEIIPR